MSGQPLNIEGDRIKVCKQKLKTSCYIYPSVAIEITGSTFLANLLLVFLILCESK